jgi:hypothetical protein
MNYYEISDFNPISSNFIIPQEHVPIRRFTAEQVLSDIALEKFNRLGFILKEVQLFTVAPGKSGGIHIDGISIGESKSAVNYVVDGLGLMKWYRPNILKSQAQITSAGTDYIRYLPEECTETDCLKLNKLTLVEVCQPHSVVNDSKDKFRYCFSIRYFDNNFDRALQRLKQWNNL